MNRFIFLLLSTLLIVSFCYAQSKPKFMAMIEAAKVRGSSDNSDAFSFTTGLAYKNMSVGVGIGIDNYLFHSIPLLIDVRKRFCQHRLQPFFSAAAGINFQHPTDLQKQYYSWQTNYQFKNGFSFQTMGGIYYKIYKHLHLIASAGYHYKTIKVSYEYPVYMINQTGKTTDIYRMNRWALSIGLAYL